MDARPESWDLMSLVAEAREGRLAPAGVLALWSAEEVEALWENILNDWPIGPFVLIDASDAPRRIRDREHLRLGPYRVRANTGRLMMVAEGAARLAALAWSLAELPPALQRAVRPEETALWLDHCLVLDVNMRRARFAGADYCPRRQLPVRLLPEAVACLKAIRAMELWAKEREWLNLAARRLHDCRCDVYLFPARSSAIAERMLANYRRITVPYGGALANPPPPGPTAPP